MRLIEVIEYFDVYYTVKRISSDKFEVAKFSGAKKPERIDHVRQEAMNHFSSDAPRFWKAGQQDKSILIVKQFLKDKEPKLAHYTVNTDRKVISHKFESIEGDRKELSILHDKIVQADDLLKECRKALQCHARQDTKDLRQRITVYQKWLQDNFYH